MIDKKLIESLWERIDDKEWQIIILTLNSEIKSKIPLLIKEGERLVKPELKRKWRNFLFNMQDFYSIKVFETALKIMKFLSEGKTFQKTKETITDYALKEGLSPFHLEGVLKIVSYFHFRGKEFEKYWEQK